MGLRDRKYNVKPCLMGEIYTKYHYEYYKTEQCGVRELKRQMKSMLFQRIALLQLSMQRKRYLQCSVVMVNTNHSVTMMVPLSG